MNNDSTQLPEQLTALEIELHDLEVDTFEIEDAVDLGLIIQTEDGLFVKAEETDFQIKGKSIARWITTLWPYMTGDYTLDQLCAREEARCVSL